MLKRSLNAQALLHELQSKAQLSHQFIEKLPFWQLLS